MTSLLFSGILKWCQALNKLNQYFLNEWLHENIIEENNCTIEKKEWKSKYNNYVIYEYEPFCPEGFTINLMISSCSYEYINFVRYLYENKVNVINYLERCII